MAKQKMDLAGIFQAVTQALAENQGTLDQADDYNHNHGSNMVQTFQTVTNALEKKKTSSDSAALSYAARTLARQANSGSSKLYAQNLAEAATHFKGKRVDERGALDLLQTLIGGQSSGGGDLLGGMSGAPAQEAPQWQGDQSAPSGDLLGALLGGAGAGQQAPQSGGGDLLGSLLGGMSGGAAAQSAGPASAGGDLLGALLGGLTGGGSSQSGSSQQSGLNLGNLLQAGMAYMQASQGGASTMEALVQAFVAGSGMGNSRHRTESTQVVVNSFLQALSGLSGQRR